MSRPLILHQVTAMDVGPIELIHIAASNGCEQVSVFTHAPQAALPGQKNRLIFPLIEPAMKPSVVQALADNGVTVNGIEFFPITAEVDVNAYVSSLALGSELGGVRAMAHIHDVDSSRAVDRLGMLCDLARAHGLKIGIEFTPLTRGCVSLERAAWLVDQVGRPDLGIGIDVLHLIRGGETPADVACLDRRYFTNAQICDGTGLHRSADYMIEARNRLLPGTGDFPLIALLRALPVTAALELEVPSQARLEAGVSARDHVREVVLRSRVLVDAAGPPGDGRRLPF